MGLTVKVGVFLKARTITGTGQVNGVQVLSKRTYQVTLSGTGVIAATVILEASNDQVAWVPLTTFDLAGSDLVTDGVAIDAGWAFTRGRVTAISGTAASVVGTASST